MSDHLYNRYLGALVGLAVGDALGAPIEFMAAGSFEPVTGLRGGGPHGIEPGQWTDDTSMALCLAESILESRGFVPKDQMERYLRWWREGHLSSTGVCFDIGNTVRASLERYSSGGDPLAGSEDPNSAGNGSLMRLAPLPMYMLHDAARAKDLAAVMSRTTHGAREAVDACRYLTGLMVGALRGESKEQLLSDLYSPVYNYWFFQRLALAPKIDAIARGAYQSKEAAELPATGYVVDTLEAALWAFYHSTDFESGALLAVNLGGDADTVGAVYGQLAGAYYGYESIPREWRESIALKDTVLSFAEALLRETKQSIRHFA